MKIKLEGGKIRIPEETIEEFAKKKGIDLRCKIEEEGVKIDLEREFFGFEVPVHIFIPEIAYENFILKIKNFKVMVSSMVIPYISIIPFIKKYHFLALDMENKVLNINLKDFIPKYLSFKIEKILAKSAEIEIEINELTISL
ncbi:MAG: hypothetical protein WHV67_03525 [Thermoanaerobaculia bacterium]